MNENGQLDKLWKKWKPYVETNCFPQKAEAVRFGSIYSGFTLLLYLLALSLLVLLGEILFHKTMSPRSKCLQYNHS